MISYSDLFLFVQNCFFSNKCIMCGEFGYNDNLCCKCFSQLEFLSFGCAKCQQPLSYFAKEVNICQQCIDQNYFFLMKCILFLFIIHF